MLRSIVYRLILKYRNLNWKMLVFVEGRKPENPEKNHRSKAKINNKLNQNLAPDRNGTRATIVGRKRSHYCAIFTHTSQVATSTELDLSFTLVYFVVFCDRITRIRGNNTFLDMLCLPVSLILVPAGNTLVSWKEGL